MDKVISEGAVRVGVDPAKRVIQVHAVDASGRVLTSRALARDRFIEACVRLPAGCVVAMEASSSAHHWARRLSALGLDPRIISAQLVEPYRAQGASGKNNPGGSTKRGDTCLRTLLIQGAESAVMTAHRRTNKISAWVLALRERSGWQKAVVALANKNARILWAVMTRAPASIRTI